MMNRKQICLPLIAAACFVLPLAASAQSFATPASTTQSAKPNKNSKIVQFTLQNKGTSTLDLKSGEESISLAAGESKTLQAAPGTRIVTASESSRGAAGTIVAQVSSDMNNSTIALH